MSDTHGAADTADTFDTEFDAAREAEADAPEAAVGAAEGGQEAAPAPKPELDLATATKRLGDTQAALKKERQAKRELADRVAALEARSAAPAPAAKDTAAPAAMPDPDVDPIGAVKFLQDRIKADEDAKEAATRQTAAQKAQQDQHAAALKRVSDEMSEHENDFRELHADYDDAAEHFAKSRREELKETGLEGKALDDALANDLTGVVVRALRAGKDPAEIVYNLAKKRGFSLDTSATKLQTIAAGQAAARSVGTGGTGGGGGNLTYGAVSNLKGAAFDAAFEKLRAAERRAG